MRTIISHLYIQKTGISEFNLTCFEFCPVFDRTFSSPSGYIYSRKMNYIIMIFHGLNTPFESVRHYTDSAKTSILFDHIFFKFYLWCLF